jgi:hypothetical protein
MSLIRERSRTTLGRYEAIHGLMNHPLYTHWKSMRRRCTQSAKQHKKYYFDRGITVCKEWEDFRTFYYDMMPTWSSGMSLDRIDNDLGYSKSNCRWVSVKEQSRNRTNNRHLECDGKIKTMAEWAEIYGMSSVCLFYRLKSGLSVKESLIKPIRKRKNLVE